VAALAAVATCAFSSCRGNLRSSDDGDQKTARVGATTARDATPAHDAAVSDAPAADDLVDVAALDDSILLDIRYATDDNFAGVAVYPITRCLLRRAVARRLVDVQAELSKRGLGLKVWDCYRPISIQQRFWKLVPDRRYVAEVAIENGKYVRGSKHNRGAAVDVTLVDIDGRELEMPTGYDDFSAAAHRASEAGSARARSNMKQLEAVMVAHGFAPLPTEWWHFDGPDWQSYPLSDRPLR